MMAESDGCRVLKEEAQHDGELLWHEAMVVKVIENLMKMASNGAGFDHK